MGVLCWLNINRQLNRQFSVHLFGQLSMGFQGFLSLVSRDALIETPLNAEEQYYAAIYKAFLCKWLNTVPGLCLQFDTSIFWWISSLTCGQQKLRQKQITKATMSFQLEWISSKSNHPELRRKLVTKERLPDGYLPEIPTRELYSQGPTERKVQSFHERKVQVSRKFSRFCSDLYCCVSIIWLPKSRSVLYRTSRWYL